MAKYHKRVFLNKTGSGHIEFRVDECGGEAVNAQFTVQDCYRKVELDFNCFGRRRRRDYLKKLRTLVKAVNEFATAYEEELGKIKNTGD